MNSDENNHHKESERETQGRGRKKRLSRKEQKARKKLKGLAAAAGDDTHEAPSERAVPANLEGASTDEVTAQNDEQDYDTNYVASSRNCGPHRSQQSQKKSAKSLGKWFPNAVLLKSLAPPCPKHKASIVLFYQYVNPLWPESYLSGFISYLCHIAENRCLGGRIRVAREGVNATLSSRDTDKASARQTLRHFARDLQGYHEVFKQTDFKYIDGLSGDRHFKDFKVFPVQELVFYGLPSDKTMGNANLGFMKGGVHLSAQDFHKKLTDPATVVVDVRNHYEAMLGRFDGQQFKNDKETEETAKSPDRTEDPKASEKEKGKEVDAKEDEKVESKTTAEYIDPR